MRSADRDGGRVVDLEEGVEHGQYGVGLPGFRVGVAEPTVVGQPPAGQRAVVDHRTRVLRTHREIRYVRHHAAVVDIRHR
ncbi:hypothetical protein D3C83_176060 [compost metagenome]